MKKRVGIIPGFVLAFTTLLIPPGGHGLAPQEKWVARYNGPGNGEDRARDIAVDGSGNVYVAGYSEGSGTGSDYATIKYNASGKQLWAKRYDGPGKNADLGQAITVDGLGNVYVTGYSWGSGTEYDYATIKYNAGGKQLWAKRYNGPGNGRDWPWAMALDVSGNVYVTGRSEGSGTGIDYATVKYDTNGKQLWVKRYNGRGNAEDWAWAIAVDGSGNVYVTGDSEGSGTGLDYVTIKYNTNGKLLWAKRYNGPGNAKDWAWAIAVDGSGNVYVTGESGGAGTDYDYATIKYNASGKQLWAKRYNGPGNDEDDAEAVAVDEAGNVYVTGFSMGAGTDYDYATIKYGANGQERWVRRYDGPVKGEDWASDIALDVSGNIYVTGACQGSGSQSDYATVKYNTNGKRLWVYKYGGPGKGDDAALALAVGASGNVYVTGESIGSGTNYDYAVIKY